MMFLFSICKHHKTTKQIKRELFFYYNQNIQFHFIENSRRNANTDIYFRLIILNLI